MLDAAGYRSEDSALAGAPVAIVDDHRLFASGLSLMLAAPPIGARTQVFDDPAAFLAAPAEDGWRVVVLDYFIPGHRPVEMIAKIGEAAPDAAILVVSGSISDEDRRDALAAGAAGFLSKTAEPAMLAATVAALAEDAPAPAEGCAATEGAAALGLSPRQAEILNAVARGQTNKEIARRLTVSPETIKTHLSEIFRRLDVGNRVEAIAAARARGLA